MTCPLAELMKAKYTELIKQYAKNRSGHALLREYWVKIMIKKVELAKEILQEKGNLPKFAKTTLDNYDVLTIDNKPTLVKKDKENRMGKERMPKVIVPVEHSFEIVLNAHLCTGHGSATAMYDWIEERNFVLAPMCTPILREVCLQINKDCPTGRVKGLYTLPLSRGPESERIISLSPDTDADTFPENTISVTILDMTSLPDNSFQCLLIYKDLETKFIQLRPMIGTNLAQEVAAELLKIFCDFAPPTAIAVEVDMKNLFAAVLEKLDNVFPNKITLMESKEIELCSQIETKLTQWMSTKISTNWSIGCHYVQWEMNKALKSQERSAFDKFFGINKIKDTTIVRKRRTALKERERNYRMKPSEIEQIRKQILKNNSHDTSKAIREGVQNNPVKINTNVTSQNIVIDTDTLRDSSNATTTNVRNTTLASSDNQTPTTSKAKNATNVEDSTNVRKSTTTNVRNRTKSSVKYEDFHHFMTLLSAKKSIRKQNDSMDTEKIVTVDDSDKETIFFCCTCELAIETKVYFCAKCQKSLHEFCGVIMQSSNSVMENVCFACL